MNIIKVQLNEIKTNYFSNLFKIKIESHFFKFFDQTKAILSKDVIFIKYRLMMILKSLIEHFSYILCLPKI